MDTEAETKNKNVDSGNMLNQTCAISEKGRKQQNERSIEGHEARMKRNFTAVEQSVQRQQNEGDRREKGALLWQS